jgi:hypothetical protein
MNNDANKFSLNNLLEFLDNAVKWGHMNRNTANAQKAACSQVLNILDISEKSDVRTLDMESVFKRYVNLNPGKIKPDSLKTYRSRVEKAVEAFLEYQKDPTNWKPTFQQRKRLQRTDAAGEIKNPLSSTGPDMFTKTLSVPFPIREDLTIMISNIPRDFKVSEAKRLAVFLEALAIDFTP